MKSIRMQMRSVAAVCGFLSAGTLALHAQPPRAILPLTPPSVSIVPSNGDVNPYGVAFVPRTLLGNTVIQSGDILVSNFNNGANLQGTGTTIVRVTPQGAQSLFFQSPVKGLTAALAVLSDGIVIAGSLPTLDGTSATVQPGSLLFIDPRGKLLGSMNNDLINGPWGIAVHDFGGGLAQIFVSNVLSGTIVRFEAAYDGGGQTVAIRNAVVIGSGYPHRTDPAALVLGPSGMTYDAQHDILYVANSADNAIYALQDAADAKSSLGTGSIVFSDGTKLHGPLGLTLTPSGHLIVANSDGSNVDPNQPSELVEFTTTGQFVAQYSLEGDAGGAFGVAVSPAGPGAVHVAAVDDIQNTVRLWTTFMQ
jgi:hypothetical protein